MKRKGLCMNPHCFLKITGCWLVLSVLVFLSTLTGEVYGSNPRGDFYVAVDGDDANAGTKDAPFATLERAQQAVRKLKAGLPEARPITVLVRAGKYFLDEAFTLTSEDSGSRHAPVRYQAWTGETPVISGGVKISGWQPYQGNILQAKLPAGHWHISKSRQLTLNGKLQIRARWPNFDASVNQHIGAYLNVEDAATPGSDTAFKYPKGALPRQWKKPHLAETLVMVGPGGWSSNVVPIASVDYENAVITLQRRTWHGELDNFHRYRHMPFSKRGKNDVPFFVANVLEELDEPGEWILDTEDGLVYFWPPEPLTSDSEVVLPRLNRLLDINGAKHVTVSGFTFTETLSGDNYHPRGLKGYGAMFPVKGWDYCGEAVHLTDASFCRIEKCTFYGLGGNAIYLEKYNLKNEIQRNRFEQVGANGICLLGTHDAHPMFNRIEDNHIRRTGSILNYTAGITAGLSDGNLIAHNDISDMPHHCVNFATNAYGRNYLEYNRIGNAAQVLHDTGSVNMWMDPLRIDAEAGRVYVKKGADRPGHILRYNYIYNSVQAYYLDDWTSNCIVYGNIFDHTWNGVTIHGGKNNLIENNIFYHCATIVGIINDLQIRPEESGLAMKGFCSGNRVRNNVFQSDVGNLWYLITTEHEWPLVKDIRIAEAERNIFYKTAGAYHSWDVFPNYFTGKPFKPSITYEFEDWQALGYDQSSIIKVDPMLIDPENKDFNLHPDSPAWDMGFKPIDMDRIGIRPDKDSQ